jgi:hypothetical protein
MVCDSLARAEPDPRRATKTRGTIYSQPRPFLEDEDDGEDENEMCWDMARAGPGSARDMVRHTEEQRKLTMLREIDPLLREPRPTKRKGIRPINHESPITFPLPPPFPENSGTHPNHGRSFFYCDPEIVAHSHRKFR